MEAEIPLKVTLAPPRVVNSSPLAPKEENALFVPASNAVPKMAAMVPGARGFVPSAKLALLTTLSAGTTGLEAASTSGAKREKMKMRKKAVYTEIPLLLSARNRQICAKLSTRSWARQLYKGLSVAENSVRRFLFILRGVSIWGTREIGACY